MLTQNGKLLYISDNAAEYLGHSMEDLLIHGDSVYDITDKQDHIAIQAELNRNVPPQPGQHINSTADIFSGLEGDHRIFLCRMNVSRNARRQMRFGDQKIVLVQGHYLSYLPLCSRNEAVFLATCTPIAMPETRECVVQGATNVFTVIHSMDMKIAHIDKNGESHLGYQKTEIQGTSWYKLIHPEFLREAQSKHRLITQSDQDRSCILLLRLQQKQNEFIWVHTVLQVRDSSENDQESMIVSTNQVLSECEASVMKANSWLYHYYTVQSKMQFGLPLERPISVPHTQVASVTGAPSFYRQQLNYDSHTAESGVAYAMALNQSLSHQQSYHSHQYYHHVSKYDAFYHTTVGNKKNPNHLRETLNDISFNKEFKLDNNNFPSHGKRLWSEPVDYSSLSTNVSPSLSSRSVPTSEIRSSCSNSSLISHKIIKSSNESHVSLSHNQQMLPQGLIPNRTCPTKMEEELIFLEGDDCSLTSDVNNRTESHRHINNQYQAHCNRKIVEARGSVLFAAVVPTRPRNLVKGPSLDPNEFIDQWNPSPPWSDSAHRMCSAESPSSLSQHELSPCVSITPPTPTSLPLYGGLSNSHNMNICGSAQTFTPTFTFEWMSDQLMPPPQVEVAIPCLNPDGNSFIMKNRYQNHPRYALCAGSHHQQLTQHLAAHGHRLLNFASTDVNESVHLENERRLLNENIDETLHLTGDKEIIMKIDDKKEMFPKDNIKSTS